MNLGGSYVVGASSFATSGDAFVRRSGTACSAEVAFGQEGWSVAREAELAPVPRTVWARGRPASLGFEARFAVRSSVMAKPPKAFDGECR